MFDTVLSYFKDIAAIPRGSGNEKGISDYLVTFAKAHGLDVIQDDWNNIIMTRPAAPGRENDEPIVLQGHMDMVCEKDPGVEKDMTKEGIDLIFDDEKHTLTADGTTLGGDDGIAVAMALALLADESLKCPRLEFVCTTGEEVGMIGASHIDLTSVKGRRLLNLDSEDEGVFLAGCAGGGTAKVSLPVERTYPDTEPADLTGVTITLDGLLGGHSGQMAASGRANAIYELFGVLSNIYEKAPFRIITFTGGGKDNAIPRNAEAVLVIQKESLQAMKEAVAGEETRLKEAFGKVEKALSLRVEETGYEIHPEAKVGKDLFKGKLATDAAVGKGKSENAEDEPVLTPLTRQSTKDVIALVLALPNGLLSMTEGMGDLPEVSLNLGIVKLTYDSFVISYCVRSGVDAKYDRLTRHMKEIAKGAGAVYSASGEYPAWEFVKESPFRDEMVATFKDMFGREPKVTVIHAGVECGLLADKLPGLDAVSIGPDMKDIHTTGETLDLASAERTYDFVRAIVEK